MKIAFLSESPADQAALAVFTKCLLGRKPIPHSMNISARGVDGLLLALDGIYRGLHYNSDVEAMVVVVDCDESEIHEPDHDSSKKQTDCRFCQITQIIERARKQLKP